MDRDGSTDSLEDDVDEPPLTGSSLINYVSYLENELEGLQHWSELVERRHEEEKRRLKERLEKALDKFDDVQCQIHSHKHDSLHAERLLHEERVRERVLEERIKKLEHDLEMKNELINHRRKRDERVRRHLEKENELLKKKATLGWMLGCLSEAYLESEHESGATPLLKMVRNIQRELEKESMVLSYSNEPPHIQLEYVEREIRRLIDRARLAENNGQPSSTNSEMINQKYIAGDRTIHSSRSIDGNGTQQSNRRINEEESEGLPSARYVVNCFNDDGVDGSRVELETRPAHIEVFEVTPTKDVEKARLSSSTWAEVKVMDKDTVNMHRSHRDIKMMLSKLQDTLDKYLGSNQDAMSPAAMSTTRSLSTSRSLSPTRSLTPRTRSLYDLLQRPRKNCVACAFKLAAIDDPHKPKSQR